MPFGGRTTLTAPRRQGPAPPRVGPWARVGPAAAPAAPAGGAPAWTPPPLPTGYYNPSRTIETEESQRGLGQLEGEVGTQRARDKTDYYDQSAGLDRQAQQQQSDYQRAQAQLRQSFQRLGTKQEEGANVAGALQSGALLQAAAKRAANEGQQRDVQNVNYGRQVDANKLARAQLDLTGAPPDAANPLGGRNFQDLTTKLTNAQANNTFFGYSQSKLAGQEAAERGYPAPTAPAAAAAAQHGRTPPPNVTTLGYSPNPQKPSGAAAGRAAFRAAKRRRF